MATTTADPAALSLPHFQKLRDRRDRLVYSPLGPAAGLVVALILGRLSTDTEANQANDQVQVEQGLAWCETFGLTPYLFPDGSSAFVMRGQPAYDQATPWDGYVLAWDLVAAGQVQAIVAQAMDRFTRNVGEAISFFDHCLAQSPQVRRIVVAGQQYDLKDPNHYQLLVDMANRGQAESAQKRVRSLNKGTQKAKAGDAAQGGLRPFGFKAGGLKLEKSEADEIAKAVSAFLAGKALSAIAADWNTRGITTSTGKPWTHNTVKQVLCSWRICGWRSHYDIPQKQGAWPAIVTRDQVEAIRAILIARVRPAGGQKQFLTGLLHCSCGCGYAHRGQGQVRQVAGVRSRLPGYVAVGHDNAQGHCTVLATDIDQEVADRFLARVNRGGWQALAAQDNSQTRADLQDQLAAVEAQAAVLIRQLTKGNLTESQFENEKKELDQQALALQNQLGLLQVPAVTGSELQHIATRWDGLTTPEKRLYLEAMVARVDLDPGKQGQPWDPSRVHVSWLA